MISSIKGTITDSVQKNKDFFVDVMTSGGVGYRVFVPLRYINTLAIGAEILLFTYHVVRDDAQLLFGFLAKNEKDIFESLISVNGVGPKTALSIVSEFDYDTVVQIIVDGDEKMLSSISGLGTKSAKRIILELQGKIGEATGYIGETGVGASSHQKDVLSQVEKALSSLGFAGLELSEKVKLARDLIKAEKDLTVEELIKRVLVS